MGWVWGSPSQLLTSTPVGPGAQVRMVDMQKLTHGVLHTKFWVVDQTHFYLGSANMDWRSLTQVCLSPAHRPSRSLPASWGSQPPTVPYLLLPALLNHPPIQPSTTLPLLMEAPLIPDGTCQPLYTASKALSTHTTFTTHFLRACSKPSPVLTLRTLMATDRPLGTRGPGLRRACHQAVSTQQGQG